jgi:hypothetical protein
MTLDANRKGKRRERDVVRLYKALDGWDATREPAMLEAVGGVTGVDVRAWGALRLAIQVRSQAKPSVWDALATATAGALPGEIPLAHVRRTIPGAEWPDNKATDVVVIGEADWLALLARVAP